MDGLTGIVIIIAVVEAIVILALVARMRVTMGGKPETSDGPRCGACGQPMPIPGTEA